MESEILCNVYLMVKVILADELSHRHSIVALFTFINRIPFVDKTAALRSWGELQLDVGILESERI